MDTNGNIKEILIKDLCSRIPYGVKIHILSWNEDTMEYEDKTDEVYSINKDGYIRTANCDYEFEIEDIKPYLFPLSSMTEEQKEEYCSLQQKVIYNSKGPINSDVMEYINWCYKNHIDVNDLIPMGLANDATGLNIY